MLHVQCLRAVGTLTPTKVCKVPRRALPVRLLCFCVQANRTRDEVLVLPEHVHGELQLLVLRLGEVGARDRLDGAQRHQLSACVQRCARD